MKKLCLCILIVTACCTSLKTQTENTWLYDSRWILAVQTVEDKDGYQEILFIELVFNHTDVLLTITDQLYLDGRRLNESKQMNYYGYEIAGDTIILEGGLEIFMVKENLVFELDGEMYQFIPVKIETNFEGMV